MVLPVGLSIGVPDVLEELPAGVSGWLLDWLPDAAPDEPEEDGDVISGCGGMPKSDCAGVSCVPCGPC